MTPHFTIAELTQTDHRKFDNSPDLVSLKNLQRLAEFLETVKTALGGKPIIINSAYRSKAVNAAVGSSDGSQHRKGCAADFKVPGMKPDEVVRAIIAAKLPFDQIIREFDLWTHISIPNTANAKPRGSKLIIDRLGVRQFI